MGEKMATILVVDNQPEFFDKYQKLLAGDENRIIVAQTGEESLDIMQSDEVHLVILEMHLPDMFGIEVLYKIMEIKPTTPCVIFTSCPFHKNDFRCWGAEAYLNKTDELHKLKTTVHYLLTKNGNNHET